MPSPTTRCAPPRRGFHNGTVSITSIGGVASTFVLKWLKALQNAHHKQLECEESSSSSAGSCSCPAIGAHTLPRQVVSCHVDDDGVFKHLADPRALNRFPHHRAVYIVGDPLHAVTSVFRRNFQCWHLYRLHNCWFSRAQREGVIPCAQPGIQSFRRRFGASASARAKRARRRSITPECPAGVRVPCCHNGARALWPLKFGQAATNPAPE